MYTCQVLCYLDRRKELLELGNRLLTLIDNESTTSELILPLLVHVQKQTHSSLNTKTELCRIKVDKHDLVWKKSEEQRAKKRKRRLITVGMRPEEKAYLDIRTKLLLALDVWATKETAERIVLDALEEKLRNLIRDKRYVINYIEKKLLKKM